MTGAVPWPTAEAARGLPRIYLCGPIGDTGEAARGGYQACNRRTLEALARLGVEAVPLPYPHPRAGGWRKHVEYLCGFLRLYARVLRCEPGSVLHLTALAVHFVYNEWPLIALARLRGCRVVYDLRAGTKEAQYASRSPWYRFVFRRSLEAAHAVMVEGEAVIPFVQRLGLPAPVWLPNHLDTDALAWRDPEPEPPAAPTLVHVGRLVPDKGVEVVLQAARELRARGLPVTVKIAGDGEPHYLARLRAETAHEAVHWLGPLPAAEVIGLLREAHCFVFPTRHYGEGQSNALTEAMACGCVPLASRHGFNEAAIGEPTLVLDRDAGAADYADAVQRLWPARWAELSARMQRRARERFSTAAAMRTLLGVYRRAAAPAGAASAAAAQQGSDHPAPGQ